MDENLKHLPHEYVWKVKYNVNMRCNATLEDSLHFAIMKSQISLQIYLCICKDILKEHALSITPELMMNAKLVLAGVILTKDCKLHLFMYGCFVPSLQSYRNLSLSITNKTIEKQNKNKIQPANIRC